MIYYCSEPDTPHQKSGKKHDLFRSKKFLDSLEFSPLQKKKKNDSAIMML